jgi:signal peptidase I
MNRKKPNEFFEWIRTIVYAVFLAVIVRTVAYEPFSIPSGSMIPTLLIGDYLFVSKFSYGYSRHSLPFSLPLIPGRIFYSEPKRGDVVVFKLPKDNRTDYIKRIVGLPGDKVQVIGGILHLNGTAVTREPADDLVVRDFLGSVRRTSRFVEILPNDRRHHILELDGDTGPLDNTPVYTVPPDHFFAMGDNRDSSKDSRFLGDVGFVPKENLVGRAEFLFFSIDGDILDFWKWGRSIRFSRFFQGIE